MTFYVIMLVIAALGSGAYLALFLTHIPGAGEERLGVYEPLPPDIGKWVEDPEPTAEGWIRERRTLYEGSPEGAGKFTYQARLRDPKTREIISVEPERVEKRRRRKVK